MNKLAKWWKIKKGLRMCHYCPDTWLTPLYENGNCMNCLKCRATYVYAWKSRNRWPTRRRIGSVGDPDKLDYIHMYFNRMKDGKHNECILVLDIVERKTVIILDFGKWTFSNPTLVLPYILESVKPSNVADKVKKILLFL